jgi:hypothetical protein
MPDLFPEDLERWHLFELKTFTSLDSNKCHLSKSSGKRSGIPLND